MNELGMTARIPIRFGRLRPLLAVLGLTPRCSYLDVAAERVRVRMGWAFRAEIPRASIRAIAPARHALSIGVHGWRGRWLVNGAAGPLATLTIDPVARGRIAGLPVRLRELTISVDDVNALIGALDLTGDRPPIGEAQSRGG